MKPQRREECRNFPFSGSALFASLRLILLPTLLVVAPVRAIELTGTNFSAVAAIFDKHCLDCHAAPDPERKLLLESFEALMKGGESGPAIAPGKSSESLLVKMVEGRFEMDGKKKIMPPGSKRKKLDTNEIALIKSWIDLGALPETEVRPKELAFPKITPKVAPRKPVNAVAYAPKEKIVAIARDDAVELQSSET